MISASAASALGEILAAAVAERALGLGAALALAAQHGELVVRALLGRLLQLGEQHPQRADALALARLHRGDEVALDGLGDAHCVQGYARAGRLPALEQERRPVAALAARALAHRRRRRRADLVGLLAQQARGDQQRAAARSMRAASSSSSGASRFATTVGACGSGSRRRSSERRRSRRRWRARSRRSPATDSGSWSSADHGREAELRGGDREHARAGAEVEQRAARLAGARELDEQLEAQLGGRVGAGAEGLRGLDHDVDETGRGGRIVPRRAHVAAFPPPRPVGGNSRQRVDQSSSISLVATSTNASPTVARSAGSAGSSPGAP